MKKRPIIFILIPLCLIIILVEQFCPVFFVRNHYSKHVEKGQYYRILVKEEAQERNKTIRYTGEITHYLKSNKWYPTNGDILIYFSKQDTAYNLKYGDVITTASKLLSIQNFSDNYPFDYKRLMQRKRIYDNIFVRKGEWRIIEHGKGNPLITKAKYINNKLKLKLLSSNLPPQESALAIGMLLGDKSNINETVQRQFNVTGLTHILCVSGMNVGIIVLFIDWILKFLSFGNYRLLFLRKFILVLIAFAICFIVDLSPSSLRVAVMMTVIFFSKYSSRGGYDSLNALSLTAFLFLCFDPLLFFNWSFQFSFLAVLGIILFARFIKDAFVVYNFNYITRQAISIAGMTLSAQSFVLPIILSRFRTFPTYFLIANIIVVPFLSLILITILIFLLFSDTTLLGTIIETILHGELYTLKSVIEFIDSLPYSSIPLYINSDQSIFAY